MDTLHIALCSPEPDSMTIVQPAIHQTSISQGKYAIISAGCTKATAQK